MATFCNGEFFLINQPVSTDPKTDLQFRFNETKIFTENVINYGILELTRTVSTTTSLVCFQDINKSQPQQSLGIFINDQSPKKLEFRSAIENRFIEVKIPTGGLRKPNFGLAKVGDIYYFIGIDDQRTNYDTAYFKFALNRTQFFPNGGVNVRFADNHLFVMGGHTV